MTGVEFVVYGLPATQGSKRPGISSKGKLFVREQLSDKLRPWRDAVRAEAVTATLVGTDRVDPFEGPLALHVVFTLAKPAAAPKRRRSWPVGQRSGDVDKLARAVCDALTDAGVWHDDAQIVELTARKAYPGEADGALDRPGARIRILELAGQPS